MFPQQKVTLVSCSCTLCRGQNVTPSTRRNHQDDDRRRRQRAQAVSTTVSTAGPSESDDLWASSIVNELRSLAMAPTVHLDRPLQFLHKPSNLVPFVLDIDADLTRPNRSHFALAAHPANQRYLQVEHRVSEIYQLIKSMPFQGQAALEADLVAIMSSLVRDKHIQWEIQSDTRSENDPYHVNTSIFFYRGASRSRTYRCVVLTALVLYHIYRAPRRAVETQLAGLRDLLISVDLPYQGLDELPKDPRTTTTYYNLHPITRQYIVCPKCHALYLWDGVNAAGLDDPVLWQCTFKPNASWKDPLCDTELWKEKKTSGNRSHYRPIKIFTLQPLKYWLGRLLSRPEIEDHIDSAAETRPTTDGIVDDIWTSPVIESLQDHEGRPFFPGIPREGRLLFSLAMDGFNPLTMKAAHTQVSSTGIWLVLLNLPKHLRYLHQNMCPAGVIPGPHKPSADEINSYVDLIVDELLEMYHPGIFFSKTYKYALGRLYKAMLIPLVCDMLAARQIIGQAGAPTAHDFCTVCDIDKDDINIFDRRDWTPKNLEHIKSCAQLWKNASSVEERNVLFQNYSIRWTPLFRLPYWDPTKYAVIDAMHTLDLGLLQNHVRVLFALSVDSPGGDGSDAVPVEPINKLVTTAKQLGAYRSCIDTVVTNDTVSLQEDLLRYHRKVLYTFCAENHIVANPRGVVVTGTAWLLAQSIADWRNGPNYSAPTSNLIDLEAELEPDSDSEPQLDGIPDINRALAALVRAFLKVVSEDTPTNRDRLFTNATKKLYIDLSDHLSLDVSHIDARKRSAKRELHDFILEKVQGGGDRQYCDRLRALLPDSIPPLPSSEMAHNDVDLDDNQEVDNHKSLISVAKLLLAMINMDTPANIHKLNKTATKKVYVCICDQLSITYSHIDLDRQVAKQQLQDLILEQLRSNPSGEYEEILQGLLPETKLSGRVVLGKEVMEIVWADMKATQTPTWVATAPPNWGTAERGKLSAAQWRVVCTIHLPITLIRLWRHETGRLRLLLDHFMDLVCAVRTANMKACSPSQIEAYDHYIFKYVSNIPRLFPDQNLKPSHHMALHIGDFLRRMGPVHSYNSPFFERYINFFHQQNTNSHPGELETTLLHAAAHSANLRAILQDDAEIRPLVCQMVDKMEKIDREDIRGYRLASILDPSSPSYTSRNDGKIVQLSFAAQAAWRQYIIGHKLNISGSGVENVLSHRQIAVGGVCYSTTEHTFRNSVVMFASTVDAQSTCSMAEYLTLKPAFVDLIFQPSSQSALYYMVIRELAPVDHQDLDPFKKYGFAGGFLCKKEAHTLKIININQVKSHAALTQMNMGEHGGEVYHILCVDRLMNIFESNKLDNSTSG